MEIDGGDKDESHWDTLCNLSEIPKWGYDESTNGEKFLAKKFEFSGGEMSWWSGLRASLWHTLISTILSIPFNHLFYLSHLFFNSCLLSFYFFNAFF